MKVANWVGSTVDSKAHLWAALWVSTTVENWVGLKAVPRAALTVYLSAACWAYSTAARTADWTERPKVESWVSRMVASMAVMMVDMRAVLMAASWAVVSVD